MPRIDSARGEAVRQLLRVEEGGAFAGLVGGKAAATAALSLDGDDDNDAGDDDHGAAAAAMDPVVALDDRDRRLVKELVAGVTRWRRRLDWVLARLSGRDAARLAPPLRQVLRIALYELWQLGLPAHALNEHVELAKAWARPEAAGLANFVLREAARRRDAGALPDPERDLDPVAGDGDGDAAASIKDAGDGSSSSGGSSGASSGGGASLRNAARRLAVVHSHPTWLAARWLREYGPAGAEALMRHSNARPAHALRANAARLEAEDRRTGAAPAARRRPPALLLLDHLVGLPGLTAAPSALMPAEFVRVQSGLQAVLRAGLIERGLCAVQDESTGLVVQLLDPQPGERLLDCCAAPGNKALLAAARMRGLPHAGGDGDDGGDDGGGGSGGGGGGRRSGGVWALDVSQRRLRALEGAAARQGLRGLIRTRACDLRALAAEAAAAARCAGAGDARASAPPLPASSFDRVLLDAPCSGTGVLAKRADLRWRRTPEELEELVKLQDELLDAAAAFVRPGGLLVYSTCSVERDEGSARVEAFLARPAGAAFALEAPPEGLMPEGVLDAAGQLVVLPHLHGGADGAFAARLRRRAEE